MKSSFYLGQYAKIKVFVHWTFLILIGFIVYSGISAGQTIEATAWHVLFILTLFVCVILHEFGHALTGRKFGFKTKDIILLPIGGVARFEKLPENPRQEFLVAIAGPVVNFFIALILYVFTLPKIDELLVLDFTSINAANFLVLLSMVNLTLGLFNLIPAFPMDGGRILRALLSMFQPREKATKIAANIGIVLAIGFMLVGIFYNPFLILIGAFIILSASSESSIVSAQALLKGHTAGEIVMRNFASLRGELTLAEASQTVLDSQATNFIITTDQEAIVGTLNRDQIIRSLTSTDHQTPLTQIMIPVKHTIPADTSLKDLYTNEALKGNAMVPVTDQGDIIGVINLENIIELLAIKKATPQWNSLLKRKS